MDLETTPRSPEGELPAPHPAFGQELIGRASDVGLAARALTGGGAVLVGPPGVGKTAVLRAVAELAPDFFFIQIRGTAAAARAPYGAMAWLISELPREMVDNPVLVLRGLKELLAERAAERRPVLVLDNADELDDLAVMVASQLCRQGAAALLLAAPELSACAPELARLWSDGLLTRIDLGPLGRAALGVLVQRTAGAPPTAAALDTVWRHSRGNPRDAELLTRDQLAAGRFRLRGGFCVQAGAPAYGGDLAESVERRLRRLDQAQRDAVDLLALCAEVPLQLLTVLAGPDTVDALEEGGYLEVRNDGQVMVRMGQALPGPVVRALVPAERRLDLFHRFGPHLGLEDRSDAACLAAGLWMASCGAALDPGLLPRAMREGRRRGDVAALERLAAAAPRPLPPSAAAELAAALLETGRAEDVLAVPPSGVSGAAGAEEELAAARLHLTRLQASVQLGRHEEAAALAELDGFPADGFPSNEAEPAAITLARAGILHLLRQWQPEAEQLARVLESADASPGETLTAQIGQARSLAVRGHMDAATELAGRLLSGLADADAGDAERERAYLELSFALLLAGRPGLVLDAGRRAALQSPGSPPQPGGGLWEVPAGLAHLVAGRADAALRVLLPACAQLEVLDPHGLLPLATAAAGAAGAGADDFGTVGLRSREGGNGSGPSVLAAVLAEHFRALSDSARAAGWLHRLGRTNLDAGTVGAALLNLLAAVLKGEEEALPDLAEAARQGEPGSGNLYALFSRTVTGSDPDGLADVAEAALDAGQANLAFHAAAAGHRLAAARGERRLARSLKGLENRAYRLLADGNRVEEVIAALSDFERTVLLRASAGESSSSLGRDLHLSPRTVDWHLGRLFRRLRVSGRGELRDLLTQAGGGEWVVPSAIP